VQADLAERPARHQPLDRRDPLPQGPERRQGARGGAIGGRPAGEAHRPVGPSEGAVESRALRRRPEPPADDEVAVRGRLAQGLALLEAEPDERVDRPA
jgi:hypothetical protein